MPQVTIHINPLDVANLGFSLSAENTLTFNSSDLELIDLLNGIDGQGHLLAVEKSLLEAIADGPVKRYYLALLEYDELKTRYFKDRSQANKTETEAKLNALLQKFNQIFELIPNDPQNDLRQLLQLKFQALAIVDQKGNLTPKKQTEVNEHISKKLQILVKAGVNCVIEDTIAFANELVSATGAVDENFAQNLHIIGANNGHAGSTIELATSYLSHIANNMYKPTPSEFDFPILANGTRVTEQQLLAALKNGLASHDPIAISKVANFIDNILGAAPALYQAETTGKQRASLMRAIEVAKEISGDPKVTAYFDEILANQPAKTDELQNMPEETRAACISEAREISKRAKKYLSEYAEQLAWTEETMQQYAAHLNGEHVMQVTDQLTTLTLETFSQALEQEILILTKANVTAESIAGQQLAALQSARRGLQEINTEYPKISMLTATKPEKINLLARKAEGIKIIADNLSEKFDKLGYPDKFQQTLDRILDVISRVWKKLSGSKAEAHKALEVSKFEHVMKFSSPENAGKRRPASPDEPEGPHSKRRRYP